LARLFFKYGAMNCGKSSELLQIAYNYEHEGYKALVLKPAKDTKASKHIVSRFGGEEKKRECDFLITPDMDVYNYINTAYAKTIIDVILIDEAQFLTPTNVKSLMRISGENGIPVMAFGLKVDFKGEPFEGSSWLFAVAQDIQELGTRTLCSSCKSGKRGTMNVRYINGKATFEGSQVVIDDKDNVEYKVVCLSCYMKMYSNWLKTKKIGEQVDYRGGLI